MRDQESGKRETSASYLCGSGTPEEGIPGETVLAEARKSVELLEALTTLAQAVHDLQLRVRALENEEWTPPLGGGPG